MERIAAFISGRRTAWVTFVLGFVVVGALFALLPQAGAAPAPGTGLPSSAESQRVDALLKRFPGADRTVAIVAFDRESGLTGADRTAIAQRAAALAQRSVVPQAVRPSFSDDGRLAVVAVPVQAKPVADDAGAVRDRLRTIARSGLPAGLTARITGPVGFQADIVGAFAGADLRLLLVTASVVAVLLIVTYRSPLLWIVPLVVVGAADGLARVVVGDVAGLLGLTVDASISGIQSVLVFGAGTNYALLLISRYREELRRRPDHHEAMRVAVRSAGPTIAASGGTVTLSLLTLLLGELSGNRALGVACAIGVVIAILAAVLWLPAALVVFGRRLFWPFVPKAEADANPAERGVWASIGRRVARRPRTVAVIALLAIVAMGSGLAGFRFGLSQTEQLLGNPESVQAQHLVDRSFSTGAGAQTIVLAPTAVADRVATIAKGTAGVGAVTSGAGVAGRTEIDLQLDGGPASDAAFTAIRQLRAALQDAGGSVATTLVGGSDATAYDQREAQQRDQAVVVPAILAVVFVILALLLRSLVAPVLLLASVLATFLASLGLGNLLFQHVFGFSGFDVQVPLFAFLFLVALGVDYNIFLTARAREERARHGTREGMVIALGATGGVITSAGVLLAAVFVVLGVLPVVALAQIGTLVCIGVLLDTLVIRTLLVPALVLITGDRFWWPSRRHADRPVVGLMTRGRGRRIVRRVGVIALLAALVAVIAFVVWAENPMRAEAGPLAAAEADAALTYTDDGSEVVLTPKHATGAGLVFFAGARVDAPAYAAKLSGLAEQGITVLIVRPVLNFAIFDPRSLASFETAAPGVRRWFVGGHSLGGVRACQYAAAGDAAGLVLFGSYCSSDLSATKLPVLSLGGERDGLSTPAKIAAARHLLPASAQLIQIPGADHGQFGDYGMQPGDGVATATDAQVRAAITQDVVAFVTANG